MSERKWWGYKHTNGSFQAKPCFYFYEEDIQDAIDSPFCQRVWGPFEADNREEALKYLEEKDKERE